MRIAHVIRRLSFADWGGTEQVVWNLAKAQLALGHDVRIFATDALSAGRDGPAPRYSCGAGPLAPRISYFHPIYPWWPMGAKRRAALDRKGGNPFVPGMGRALRNWGPDVIHCHAMGRMAELCVRTAEKTGARSVVSLHGGAANVPEAEARSLVAPTRHLLPWGKAVELALGWKRRVPEDFGGIVCVGEDEADYWKARHGHVLFLPNGVDVGVYAGASRCASAASSPAPVALCVARIDRQKNQLALVGALARNPALRVRLVGSVTQPDYRDEIIAKARELGVADRLEIIGPLLPGSGELAAEYHSADLFVLPSRHEPFGIAVLEAWAAGLPVAAADVGGMGRLCAAHPGSAELFDPADADSLDSAIGRALAHSAELSAAGRVAAGEYAWPRLAERLVAFYRAL